MNNNNTNSYQNQFSPYNGALYAQFAANVQTRPFPLIGPSQPYPMFPQFNMAQYPYQMIPTYNNAPMVGQSYTHATNPQPTFLPQPVPQAPVRPAASLLELPKATANTSHNNMANVYKYISNKNNTASAPTPPSNVTKTDVVSSSTTNEKTTSTVSSNKCRLTQNNRKCGWEKYLNKEDRDVIEKMLTEADDFEVQFVNFEKEFKKMEETTSSVENSSLVDYNSMWMDWKQKLLGRREQMMKLLDQTLDKHYKNVIQHFPLFLTQAEIDDSSTDGTSKNTNQSNSSVNSVDKSATKIPPNNPTIAKATDVVTNVETSTPSVSRTDKEMNILEECLQTQKKINDSMKCLFDQNGFNQSLNNLCFVRNEMKLINRLMVKPKISSENNDKKAQSNTSNDSGQQTLVNKMDNPQQKQQHKIPIIPTERITPSKPAESIPIIPTERIPPSKPAESIPIIPTEQVSNQNKSSSATNTNANQASNQSQGKSSLTKESRKASQVERKPVNSSKPVATKTDSHPAGKTSRIPLINLARNPCLLETPKIPLMPTPTAHVNMPPLVPNTTPYHSKVLLPSPLQTQARTLKTIETSKHLIKTPRHKELKKSNSKSKSKSFDESKDLGSTNSYDRKVRIVPTSTSMDIANHTISIQISSSRSFKGRSVESDNLGQVETKAVAITQSVEKPASYNPNIVNIPIQTNAPPPAAELKQNTYHNNIQVPIQVKKTRYSKHNNNVSPVHHHERRSPPDRTYLPPIPSRQVVVTPTVTPTDINSFLEQERQNLKEKFSYTDNRFFIQPRKFTDEPLYINDLLELPSRSHRPPRIVIIIRGLPGSGKSYLAKLIKNREERINPSVKLRLLSLDDYFFEEREHCDPYSRNRKCEMVYEYDAGKESDYKFNLFKSYRKCLLGHYYNFVIVDSVNSLINDVQHYYTCAIENNFIPYVVEMEAIVRRLLNDCINGEEIVAYCYKHNLHGRSIMDIRTLYDQWELLPVDYLRVDAFSLISEQKKDQPASYSSQHHHHQQSHHQQSTSTAFDEDERHIHPSPQPVTFPLFFFQMTCKIREKNPFFFHKKKLFLFPKILLIIFSSSPHFFR